MQDRLLNSVTLTFAPDDEAPDGQPFRHFGSLSRIISRQYNQGTTEGGKIVLLTPRKKPDELGNIIPLDHKSESLPSGGSCSSQPAGARLDVDECRSRLISTSPDGRDGDFAEHRVVHVALHGRASLRVAVGAQLEDQ